MPPIEVPWPPMYLVVECMTIAAPWSIGRQITGVGRRIAAVPRVQHEGLGVAAVGRHQESFSQSCSGAELIEGSLGGRVWRSAQGALPGMTSACGITGKAPEC